MSIFRKISSNKLFKIDNYANVLVNYATQTLHPRIKFVKIGNPGMYVI